MRTIDATPTWSDLIRHMLYIVADTDQHESVRTMIEGEFIRMAEAADRWNEHIKTLNSDK